MSKFVLTAQLQLQAPNNVSQIVSQIQNQLNNVSVNVQVQGSAQANKQLQQITQSTNAATTAAGRMGNAFAVSIRRFAAFSIATRAVGLFTSTLADAVKTAIDFERELIKISQVTGRSVSSLRDLTDSVTSLATGLGVTSGSLLEVTTVLTQAGLSSDDTKIALESLAKAALAPNFDSISETAEGAIAILAQFKQGVGALEGQLSSIDAVAGAFAVEAGDLIDVIRRSGGVFKASGGSLNELLALFTSVRATTRESAESIGTGLRTIFTRIQRPETIEFLKQFGVELVDLNGKFVGPYEAIKRLSEAISGLGEGDLTFIKIAEELGGFRQIGKVLPLLQQFSTAQAALNVAQNAGNGLTKNAEMAQASLAIRIIKVKEEFLALVRSVTETTTFQVMANTALALASALIKIADSIKPLLPLLAAVAAFKAVKGIGGFLGGIGAGLTSGKTFHSGGRVHAFASGGLVPGTGSGTADDVPAMLSSGEFVMKQSAVKRIGANNLAAMNRGGTVQKFKDGGRTIVGAKANLKSKQVRDSKFDKKKDVAGSGNVQFDVQQGQVGAFVLSPPKGTEGGYSGQAYPFTLTPGKKGFDRYAPIIAKQSGLSLDDLKGGINATINPATYPVFYPGLTEGRQNLSKNSQYSNAVHIGFMDGISAGVNSTISSVASQGLLDLPPSFNTNENSIQNIIGKIQGDNQIRSTMEGYLFEGMISAFTGASAAGGTSNFDFPRAAISQNKNKLGALFGSQAEINKLTKAEAKRSYGEVGTNIQRKLSNDIISGNISGVKLRTTGQRNKMSIGGIIQKFAAGGRAKGIQGAPLVDDIPNASGSILPRPSAAIQALIKAGGGAVDVDRTIKRTVGDTAYAKAPTPGAKEASLNTYFRDEAKRLQDLQSAPVTQFGKELKVAIQSGRLDARKISIISKSKRVKGAAEYLSSQFGIPVQNMVFTQGASKQPAIDAIRNKGSRIERVKRFLGGIIPQRFALGGMGKASRKVDYESGVGPSPFASQKSNKLGQEVYALQKSSGLNNLEFGDIVQTANTLGYNTIPQFKQYLVKRVAEKKNKSQLKTNVPSLLNSLKDDSTPQAKPRQVAMAQQLSGPEATPQTKKLSPEAEKLRIMLGGKPRAFASGGLVPGVGNSDTVPATLQEGDFVIRKSSVSKLGAENLASMAGYAAGGNVSKSVPALLTPGEFVFDEPSAKSIGYGNLNRMNKVGKYAAGGFVGVQKFATGTSGTGAKGGIGAPIGATGGLFNLDIGDNIVKDLKLNATGDILRTKLLTIPALLMRGTSALANDIADFTVNLDALDYQIDGLGAAVVQNGQANKRSVQAQAALIAALRDMNFNQLVVAKAKLEADTAAITGNATVAAATSPASPATTASGSGSSNKSPGNATAAAINQASAFQASTLASMSPKDAAMTQASMKKNSAVYDQLAIELEKMSLETKDSQAAFKSLRRSLDKGLPAQDAYNKAIESANASVSKSGKITRDVAAPQSASEKFKAASSPLEKQQIYMEAKASKGTLTNKDIGAGLGAGMSQAQAKAIIATNQQAASAQKAAQANLQEASASNKAAAADMQESMSTTGGTKDFGNFAMGLSLVSGTLQSLLPPLQENSSVFLQMAHGGLTLVTTLSGVAFALSAFGISLNASTISSTISSAASFLMGTAGAVASTATLTLAGSAATASVALGGLAGAVLGGISTFIAGLAPAIGAAVNIAGPLVAAGAAFFAIQAAGNALVESFMNYEKKLKKATEAGNIEESRKIATEQQSSKATVNVTAGAVAGGIIGSFFGPIGTALGAAAGAVVAKGLSDLPEYAGQVAASQAATIKAQNSLAKASEDATKALSNFEKGNISATELLQSTSGAANDVAVAKTESNKLQEQSQKEISREGDFGGLRGGLRNVVTLGGLLGESTGEKQARIESEQKKSRVDVSKAENKLITDSQPVLNSISGEVASSGGSFEDVLSRIKVDNKGLYDALISQGTQPLSEAFNNIKKEVERAQKAFNAMNLGMQNVQGAAAAAALGVNNYVASQQAGNVGLEQSLAVLEASVTSAAQGISSADFGKALSDASEVLYEFGANPEQVTKFQRNVSAVNDVQKNQSSIFGGAKDKLAENIRKSSGAQGRREAFSKSIDEQLAASGYDEATRQRFKDASANMSDDQLKKIGEGDFTAFEESINELGKKTMEQVSGPLKAAIEIQKQLNDLTKQRIDAERQLMSAQLEASNVRMEAMDITAKYGGPKVTPEMRAKNTVEQANIQSKGIKGVANLNTGSAAELSARTQQLSARQAEISGIRTRAAQGDSAAQQQLQGESGLNLQEEEKKIQDAAKSQIQATRDLIKSKEEELKIIKEKNQLERSSIDALVSGDIEKFFDQQAAIGAQAAVATGDQRMINQFGASALGAAAQETKRQQEAGVQDIYGQKLSGPGGLTERTYGAALSTAGIQNPLAMAQVAAGSTGAEAAVESDIRDLAATMGPAADIQVEAANNQVLAAQMQLDAARAKGEQAVAQMQARQMATGGMVYASRGIFVPRGTDTVPAMLTPGEFVVRREAVQRGNNLQMLQSMNRGSNTASDATGQSSPVAMMARGGKVRYYAQGDMVSQEGGGGGGSGGGGSGFGFNLESLSKFAEALTSFNSKLEANIKNLANTKFTIKLETANINVNLTGASLLKDLTDGVQAKIYEHVGQEISQYRVGNGGKLEKSGSLLNNNGQG